MTEEHAKNLYKAFQTQGHKGTCIAHVADLTNECYNCCIKRLAREEEEKERKEEYTRKCELFMKDFTKL